MTTETETETASKPGGRLPPRPVIRAAWVIHRAIHRLSGGRMGLRPASEKSWGMMRLKTIGRKSGRERAAILGYYEDGPILVTMAIAAEPGAGTAVLNAAGITAGRLCILSPYTGADRFEEVTGVQWPQVESEAISASDSMELVVALSGDEVVAWAEVGRPRGSDLLGGSDRCSH